ncbi:hypothetical protein AV530_013403 [Patagioenas fasciata monilis]|uniref:Uncharacterized protein n=1 Tax=Patagioenas fasciata monilis TaxID=372326 RepID=A0A1V4JP93_PATFA|nr:hypothetical protein AV530_013403 [Patagioenas fasciata monilis]
MERSVSPTWWILPQPASRLVAPCYPNARLRGDNNECHLISKEHRHQQWPSCSPFSAFPTVTAVQAVFLLSIFRERNYLEKKPQSPSISTLKERRTEMCSLVTPGLTGV